MNTDLLPPGVGNLPRLSRAEEIRQQLDFAEEHLRHSFEHYVAAGLLLIAEKKSRAHGTWTAWLEQNIGIGEREAQRYMQVADHADELLGEEKRHTMSDLSLNAALKQLSKPQRATAEDVSQMLQNAGGPAPAPVRQPRAQTDDLWTASLQHKAEKASVLLTRAIEALLDSQTKGLSSYSITETLRSAAIEARHASVALDELAFSFEK